MAKYQSRALDDLTAAAKALGDENRVRVVALLKDGELCLCQIIDILGLAPSTISKHMSILRQARLIEQRKEGRWHYYRLANGQAASPMVKQALRWVMRNLECDPSIVADAKRLRAILRKNPEELTSCYRTPIAN